MILIFSSSSLPCNDACTVCVGNIVFTFQELTLLAWARFQRQLWRITAESRYGIISRWNVQRMAEAYLTLHCVMLGVCLQPDHQHVRGGVQHRDWHQPRGGDRVGQEEGRRHEGLRGEDGRDDYKQSLKKENIKNMTQHCDCNKSFIVNSHFTQSFYTKQSLICSILLKVALSS